MIKFTKIILPILFIFSILQTACAPIIITAPTLSSDRRGFDGQIIDQGIEFSAMSDTQTIKEDFRVDFISFNKKVLVVGQASNQETIDKIIKIVKNTKNVEQIYNRMTVGKNLSYKAIANDAVITTNIISRILSQEKNSSLSALLVKVYTEDRVVYLMGFLSKEEAEQAINIAQTSKGPKKVVPLIEIQNLKK